MSEAEYKRLTNAQAAAIEGWLPCCGCGVAPAGPGDDGVCACISLGCPVPPKTRNRVEWNRAMYFAHQRRTECPGVPVASVDGLAFGQQWAQASDFVHELKHMQTDGGAINMLSAIQQRLDTMHELAIGSRP